MFIDRWVNVGLGFPLFPLTPLFSIVMRTRMSIPRRFVQGIDFINEWIGRGVAWATFGLVLLVFVDVVLRYVFKTSYVFAQEMEWHLFSFIFLIGAGYTLLHEGHVRVDIVYQLLGPKPRAWINLIGVILFLIPGCYLVIKTSITFVLTAWEVLEGSPDPGGVPYRFIVKGFIPVGFFLLLLQGISLGIKSFWILRGVAVPEDQKS